MIAVVSLTHTPWYSSTRAVPGQQAPSGQLCQPWWMQRKGHGFLPDRYHCSLVELAGLKCPSYTKCQATACVFAMLEVLLLAAVPQELLSQVGGEYLAATAPDPTQVPSAAAGSWRLSAPAPGSPRRCPGSGSPPVLSTTLQDFAAHCAGTGAARHQSCPLQRLSTAQHFKSF